VGGLALGATACAGPITPGTAHGAVRAESAKATTTWHTAAVQATSTVRGRPVTDASCRQVLRSTLSGRSLRLRLSNGASPEAVTLRAVTVGLRAQGAALQAAPRAVTVGGSATVTLPAHGYVTTDPVPLPVLAGESIAVSFAVDGAARLSEHKMGAATGWCTHDGTGDRTTDVSGGAFTVSSREGLVLEAVEVRALAPATVLAVGDSLTDPPLAPDGYRRWTDVLAQHGVPTANAAIAGNRVVLAGGYGPTLVERFDRDVLSRPGIGTVVLLVGTNDISAGVSARRLIEQLAALSARAQRAGLRVVIGTIPPAANRPPDREVVRQAVNDWVRRHDRYVDADRVLRDPSGAVRVQPAYDWGDGLHLSVAGQRVLAAEVQRVLAAG
jgi:lysophospholipase L1-like esterase